MAETKAMKPVDGMAAASVLSVPEPSLDQRQAGCSAEISTTATKNRR
jgi:hypothetical protein